MTDSSALRKRLAPPCTRAVSVELGRLEGERIRPALAHQGVSVWHNPSAKAHQAFKLVRACSSPESVGPPVPRCCGSVTRRPLSRTRGPSVRPAAPQSDPRPLGATRSPQSDPRPLGATRGRQSDPRPLSHPEATPLSLCGGPSVIPRSNLWEIVIKRSPIRKAVTGPHGMLANPVLATPPNNQAPPVPATPHNNQAPPVQPSRCR